MARIEVFEDPWPRSRKNFGLGEAAVLHLYVSNFFLKLLPHFPSDDDGRITNEALVYSEWRYIVYIRFLQRVGLSPHEVPPPWDVALIWYCHLMSTIRFHNHLIDSGHTAYGLYFNQFPLLELYRLIKSDKWCNKKGQGEWDSFIRKDGYELTYQLWSHTPWEETPGGLTRLFRKSPTAASRRLSKVPGKEREEKYIHIAYNPLQRRCVFEAPSTTNVGKKTAICSWSLKEYTERRSRPWASCDQTVRHERLKERCNLVELTPWPTIQDTKTALYRQIAFWTALSKAQTSQPDFIGSIPRAQADYDNFMSLFRHRTLRASQFDPHAQSPEADSSSIRLVPPTLPVDLLWHTHRLHPGSYWPYCEVHSLRLIDAFPAPSPDYFHALYSSTRDRWRAWLPHIEFPMSMNSTTEWVGLYTPETALAVGPETIRTTMNTACVGWLPYRRRRVPARRVARPGDSTGGGGGGGVGGDSGPGCGGGGGDGGGGGGGGGDGGG